MDTIAILRKDSLIAITLFHLQCNFFYDNSTEDNQTNLYTAGMIIYQKGKETEHTPTVTSQQKQMN